MSTPLTLEPTKSVKKAQFATCEECGTWLGSVYWTLDKAVAMHKRGTSHKINLWVVA